MDCDNNYDVIYCPEDVNMYDCFCNKHIYKKHIVSNINLDEVDEISSDYITFYNKKFDFYYIDYTFRIQLDNDNTASIEINNHINTEFINLKSCLLYFIDSCQSRGFNFSKINHMIITTLTCMCNKNHTSKLNSKF